MFGDTAVVRLSSQGDRHRSRPPFADALGAITTTRDEAIATAPFLTLLRSGRDRNIGIDEPLATIVANGSNHGLVLPLGGFNRKADPTTTGEPFRTRVTRDTEALFTNEPFITMLRNNQTVRGIRTPMATVTTSGSHHALTVPPFMLRNYGGNCEPQHNVERVTEPVGTITVRDHHALVIPYRRGRATTTREPMHTVATRDSMAMVQPDDTDIAECRLRMLKPREHLRAQRFPDDYIVTGNQGEQTMQAGNAVSSNVAHWLGRAVAKVL